MGNVYYGDDDSNNVDGVDEERRPFLFDFIEPKR